MVNGHKSAAHSDSPECQMAALVRHALAEVCTVPVLPVVSDLERTFIVIIFHYFFQHSAHRIPRKIITNDHKPSCIMLLSIHHVR